MVEIETGGPTRQSGGRRQARGRLLRVLAAAGAAAALWIAGDTFVTNVLHAGGSGGAEFFLFWGVPFAVAAGFLAWYAARGSSVDVRAAARSGCLGSLIVGGSALAILLSGPMVLEKDALRGAVAAFQYAPLAATLGLGLGLATHLLRRRGG